MTRRLLFPALLALVLLATAPSLAVAQRQSTPAAQMADESVHTLAYQEITNFTVSPNSAGGQDAPVISADGRSLAFAVAPGTGDPATPNRIFLMQTDGSGQQEVDSYPSLCYCGSAIDLSDDGATVISTDALQLRIADASGSTGRELITLASNEINAARISGNGAKVFFRVYRDTTVDGTDEPIERGLYVINADGSDLRQIVSPRDMEALGLPPTDFFGSNGWALDASTDGAHIVFGAFNDPQSGGWGQGLFGVNIDGSGLQDYLGRVEFLIAPAISGDGTMVAYTILDASSGLQSVGVVPFTGGNPRLLFDSSEQRAVTNGGFPDSRDRIQLSQDGRWLLLGSSGVLVDVASGALLALGVPTPGMVAGSVPLVSDGLPRATMDGAAKRILFLARDEQNQLQLVRLDRDPAEHDLTIINGSVDPPSIQLLGASTATVRAQVVTTDTLVGVGAIVLRDGMTDINTRPVVLVDDGTQGDGAAGDGMFAGAGISTDCCASAGPRVVRIQAEATGANGLRLAVAIDVPGFAVEEAE